MERYTIVNSSDEVADNSSTDAMPTRSEQSNMSAIEVTESDIDAIDNMATAIQTCRKHKLVTRDLNNPTVSSLRMFLKHSLLCKGTRADIEDTLKKRQHTERPRMDNMITLYREAFQLITENDIIFNDILKFNQNVLEECTLFIANLQNYRSPILVLGETGAGKTSFINLLLGERLLPTSVLSNTHTICELSYSPSCDLVAEVEYVDQPTGLGVKTVSFKENRNAFVAFIEAEAQKNNVRKITLHGPFNILQNNVIIVDSPGVGESTQMTDVVLGYVEKAAAFIYVIDMSNAGGVQQRVQEFIAEVQKKETETHDVKVQNAMFVCNKLDEVPTQEQSSVIEDTVGRLKQLWNELDASQIIPFSTKEAQWIQDKGAVAPKFKNVLERLVDLIPAAQYMTTRRAQTWLRNVLDDSLKIVATHIDNARLNKKQLLEKKNLREKRSADLEKKMHVFISQQRENLETKIKNGAAEIYDRVNAEQTRERVCSFDESALPKDKTWHDAAANIRTQLFEKILKEMNLQKLADDIEGQIKKELESEIPSFQSMLNTVQVKFTGRMETVIEEKTVEFLPEYIKKVYGRSIGLTALLTPAMPLICLGRLPAYLVQRFSKLREMSEIAEKYTDPKGSITQIKEVCEKYARYVFQHVVKKMEIEALVTETMQVFYGRIDELDKEMKETISSDRKFTAGFPDSHGRIQSELVKIQEIYDKIERLKTKVNHC